MAFVKYVAKNGLTSKMYNDLVNYVSENVKGYIRADNASVGIIRELVDEAIEDFVEERLEQERSEITAVCQLGDVDGLKKLFERGYTLKNDYGASYLREATAHGQNEMAKFLIENGADLDYDDYIEEHPPIVYAIKYCSLEVIKMLIDRGVPTLNYDMLFGTDPTDTIWDGDDVWLEKTEPRQDVIEYLKTVKRE